MTDEPGPDRLLERPDRREMGQISAARWTAIWRKPRDAVLKLAAAQPGERVLDIGCGAGATSLLLAEAVGPGGA